MRLKVGKHCVNFREASFFILEMNIGVGFRKAVQVLNLTPFDQITVLRIFCIIYFIFTLLRHLNCGSLFGHTQ